MKKQPMEYVAPTLSEHQMFMEGLLCISSGSNEGYGPDPDEEDSIF